jgi:hypothetical protein
MVSRNCRSRAGAVVTATALTLFSATPARGSDRIPGIYLGAGMLYQDANRTAVDETGGTSISGTSYFDLTLAGRFLVGPSWGLSPVLNYTPFGAAGADTGEKSRLLTGDIRLFVEFTKLDLHTGPGVMMNTLSGSGGTAVLSNGNSSSTFGLPAGSTTTRLFYWEAGVGLALGGIRFDLDALVTDTLTHRRAVYPMFTVSLGLF